MRKNQILGFRVHDNLVSKGIETPYRHSAVTASGMFSDVSKLSALTGKFEEVLALLELDMTNESLCGTPERIAKMFLYEVFAGLDYANFPDIMTIPNVSNYDEMVLEKNVDVKSMCEHHFVAIDGHAVVGYIPNDLVIGLSKMNRIVNFFSRRPQVQERLTEQIHAALCLILETRDVAVLIKASHLCVKHRGVQDSNASMVTSKLSGSFKEDASTRSEFMNLARTE